MQRSTLQKFDSAQFEQDFEKALQEEFGRDPMIELTGTMEGLSIQINPSAAEENELMEKIQSAERRRQDKDRKLKEQKDIFITLSKKINAKVAEFSTIDADGFQLVSTIAPRPQELATAIVQMSRKAQAAIKTRDSLVEKLHMVALEGEKLYSENDLLQEREASLFSTLLEEISLLYPEPNSDNERGKQKIQQMLQRFESLVEEDEKMLATITSLVDSLNSVFQRFDEEVSQFSEEVDIMKVQLHESQPTVSPSSPAPRR
jgi:hypothetical protein